MPVLDLNDPVGFQLLRLSSDDDEEMMEGVACLLGLRHKSPLRHPLRRLDGGKFAINKGSGASPFSQTSKAIRGGENGGSENGKNSNSLRAATSAHVTVDLGVQDFNKKRKRATREEVAILRRAFVVNPLPPLEVRMSIAQQLNWTPRKVKIWFQNERAKVRKRTREGDLLERMRTPDSQDENDRSPSRSGGVVGGALNHTHPETPTTLVVGGGGRVSERPFTILNRSATPSAVLQTVPTISSPSRIRSPFTPPRLSSSAPDSSPTTEDSPLSHPQIHCAAASVFSSHPANFNPLSLLDHQQRLVIPQS